LRLGSEILAAAAAVPLGAAGEDIEGALDVAGLGQDERATLLAAAAGLTRYSNRLEQILQTGVLRVGSTGDYAPFSHRGVGSEAAVVGIDIDLARSLAAGLGVAVEFVPTTWPSLLADLLDGRYDIAMSGVSRILERQRHGYLSRPYYAGGKAAIARCEVAAAFGSLAAIDQPGVRVIVNPGGTNERFVDTRLHRAEKVSHPDNRTIFRALAAGDADLMITDRVEIELQTVANPELCATPGGPFSYQQKAYLMPRDEPWRAFVDTWLELALADGTVAAAFRDHGIDPGALATP